MPDLTTDDLKTLLAAATPGPWDMQLWRGGDRAEEWDVMADSTADSTVVATCLWSDDDAVAADVVRANARVIALAPALAAEVIRLRARAEAAEALLREAGEVLDCFGACADDWHEMGDNRIVNSERLVWGDKPIFVGNLRAARDLAAKIDAALEDTP